MHSLKTRGVVIKRSNYGEADRILTIFSDRFGKVKVMARGVRKISSKLAGNLEPYNIVDLLLHQGKTFFIATGAVIEKRVASKGESNLDKFSKFNYAGELIDKLFEQNDRATDAFDLFEKTIVAISESDSNLILPIFELKIIEEAGFKPEIYTCLHCKKDLLEGRNYWDKVEGGIICEKCQKKIRHGITISNQVIKLFRLIEKNNIDLAYRLKLRRIYQVETKAILDEYILNLLEQKLKSQDFLDLIEKRNTK